MGRREIAPNWDCTGIPLLQGEELPAFASSSAQVANLVHRSLVCWGGVYGHSLEKMSWVAPKKSPLWL